MAPRSKLKVRIRMYRQGLGDCFLLSFIEANARRPYHMLIDCGVLKGTEEAKQKMRAVVDDIARETDGMLDLLVATHEHWDHLSGFHQARDLWDDITVSDVWLAWTEDNNTTNTFAQQLQAKRAKKVEQLRKLVGDSQALAGRPFLQGIDSLLEFFGDPLELADESKPNRATTRAALQYVRDKSQGNCQFHTPGTLAELEGIPGVRVYVLGPPQDELIFQDDPSTLPGEVFITNNAFTLADSFFAVVPELAATSDSQSAPLLFPFEQLYRINVPEAQNQPFFKNHYYGSEDADLGWRQIDEDWLNTASELALALDNDTNNTSLVLAIELTESGKVLLFPADAQIGNWRSWRDLSWTVKDADGQTRTVTTKNLLNQTVFYKVGHHGSHNATLRDAGLEQMSRDLVAMIPVDKAMADLQGRKDKVTGKPKGWNLPFPALLDGLKQKTSGRVIRADSGLPSRADTTLSDREWKRFQQAVEEGPNDLYIDYTIVDD